MVVRPVGGVLLRICWLIGMVVVVACGRPDDTRGDESELSENEAAGDPDSDNPTLRRQAMADWFDERHTGLREPFSIEFRKRMLRTAEQERQRWSALMPDPKRAGPITGTSWTNLGPTKANKLVNGVTLHVTDAGRVRTIIVDGTTIYLATAGGGVWKRTNGVWSPITETIGTLSCGSLAMDPANHDVLYLGLGDPLDQTSTGLGMLKSVDGGATWSSPVFVGFSSVITQVMVDPNDSTIVLAGTDLGLYRSTDAGATFHAIPVGVGLGQIWSIASTGAGSFVLSLERGAGGQVFTSADHGATWTLATGFTSSSGVARITVASAPSNPSIVYGIAATRFGFTLADFFKSVDAGRTWTALGVTTTSYINPNSESSSVGTILGGQGWYSQLVVVSPTDPDTVYWGGKFALAKTTDGGHTFSQVSNWLAQFSLPYVHADHHTAAFDAAGNLFVGTDGGIFESTDGGATFSDALNEGVVSHLLYSVSSSQSAPDVVLGGMQDDGTRLRIGASSVFDQVIGGDGFGTDVHRTNAQQMLGTIQYLQIQKSTNGGASWFSAMAGITDSGSAATAPFFTRLVPWEGSTTGNEIFTCSLSRIYKSTNYASPWTTAGTIPASDSIRNFGVAASNINILGVVTTLGHVLLSIDGGARWTTASALPDDPWGLSWIHFDPSDPDTIFVASVDTFSTHHLWKSTTFGATWTVIDNGLPANAPVNVIKSDRAPAPGQAGQVLYAGTHMGVYRSTDGGASWSRFGAGMPLVSVMDLYISPDDSLVRAATYGRGFWELSAPAANDFWITASPTKVSVLQGNSGATTLSTLSTTGTAETIAFSASGLPAGATATFSPTSVTAGGSSTLTLAAGRTTPAGTYTVTVTATAPSVTHTQTVTFVVITRPDFSISASPTTVIAVQGDSGTTAVSTASTAGAHETVALSASGLPGGATATFTPTSVTAGGSSTLTLAAGATTAAGTYTVTITGTAPSAAHTTTVSLVVLARPEFSISASPTTVSVVQSSSDSTTVSTASTAGTSETIALSASGVPPGATATFVPSTVTAGGSSMLTLAANGTTAPGTYTVTITGAAPSATHTTTVSLLVIARPDFSISASPTTLTILPAHSDTTAVSTMSTAGVAETVALAATGLPAGATAAFMPASVGAGEPSTLTLAADATTAPGTYPITITGTAPSATHTATVSLVVIARPDFSITASPAAVTVGQGRSITTAVSTTSTAGTAETIAFSVTNVPAGATATLAATSATAGGSSTLTLAADATTPPGTYAITITGTAPSATHTAIVSFVVTADFAISASPPTVSVMQGGAGAVTLSIAATGSAADTVTLSASGLPSGVTAAFMPPNITTGSTVILTLTTDATTPAGTYPITVTGIGTAAMHTAPVTLDVTATPSQGGGCGCDVDPEANAMNGGLFAIVLGFIVRRRRRSSSL